MTEYNQKILRKLQLKELEILKDFDMLCKSHNIPYVVFYGAGIGVLRHGGFIPWDDDIDVMMLREDFEKFLCVAKEEYSDRYNLLTAEENIDYPMMNAHWGPKNTAVVSPEFKNASFKDSICVDIFPLDNISDNEAERKKQCFLAWFWNKLMILRQIPFPAIHYHGLKQRTLLFLCGAVHVGMMVLHISPKWLYRKCKKAFLQYSKQQTKRVTSFVETTPVTYSFTREELFPPCYLSFEGETFPFPNQLETLLTRVYGDYMQLPSVENRVNHLPLLVDFGDGEIYEDVKLKSLN